MTASPVQPLFPKPPKRKLQPSSDRMREQLALSADVIIDLRVQLHRERTCPYWRRLLGLGPGPVLAVWSMPMPTVTDDGATS